MVVARSELYQLVWSKPMTHLATQLQVSDSYLARVCKSLRIPRPSRGYWAKLAVGKAPAVVPLPEAVPGQLLEWSKGSVLPPELPNPTPCPNLRRRTASQGKGADRPPAGATHPLIAGARKHFENSREVKDDAYLRPFKKHLVDIATSISSLTRALSLANEIFNALQVAGHHVLLVQGNFHREAFDTREVPSRRPEPYYHSTRWRPSLPTVVFIDGISIGLALIEMSEEVLMRYMDGRYIRESDYKPARRWNIDHSWTTTQDVPSNRFRLVAYSPHPLVSWSTSWQETAGSTLSHQIPKILAAIKGMAAEQKERLAKAEEERARWRAEMEAEQERQARQTDLAKIRESETASVRELEEIIQAWGRRRNLDMFFDRVSEAAAELSAGELQQVSARLKLARESLGSIDPLQRFLEWKAPLERYQPRYFHLSGEHDSNSEEKADIED